MFLFYNTIGKLVFDSKLNQGEINQINIKGLSQGVYFYRLLDQKEVIDSGKLILE